MAIATVNPATAEILALFDPLSEAETKEKVRLAAETFRLCRIVAAEPQTLFYLTPRRSNGFTHLGRDETTKLFFLRLEDLGDSQQYSGALSKRRVPKAAEHFSRKPQLLFRLSFRKRFKDREDFGGRRIYCCYGHRTS